MYSIGCRTLSFSFRNGYFDLTFLFTTENNISLIGRQVLEIGCPFSTEISWTMGSIKGISAAQLSVVGGIM